jgi:hypothetical protein
MRQTQQVQSPRLQVQSPSKQGPCSSELAFGQQLAQLETSWRSESNAPKLLASMKCYTYNARWCPGTTCKYTTN